MAESKKKPMAFAEKAGKSKTKEKLEKMDKNGLINFIMDMKNKMKTGEKVPERLKANKGGMMKKKGYAMGGMKKKGYAKGGGPKPDFLDIDGDGNKTEPMKSAAKGANKGGMMKKKGYAKGGMKKKGYAKGGMKKKGYAKGGMKKKAYTKGGKVAMYNQGGMIKSTGTINTGIKKAPNTYK